MKRMCCLYCRHESAWPVAIWLLASGLALAGNTGSIAGRVIEERSGEPLAGANIIVEETELGASADASGRYVIINVPPGEYRVTASCMAYTHRTYSGVRVVQDNTATLDFRLADTVLGLGIIIDVTDSRVKLRPIDPHTPGVEHTITDSQFTRLPVYELKDLVSLSPGVTKTRGGSWIHVRGGRYDDVAYLVNGIQSQDAIGGTIWASPKPTTDALQSVVVVTGGFDAEYGEAMSGIIKAVTKEGGSKTSGRLRLATDELLPGRTGYNFGYNRLSFSLGGPTPVWKRLRYFLSTEYLKTDDDRGARYRVAAPRGEYAADARLSLQMPESFFLSRQGLKLSLDGYLSNYQWQPFQQAYRFWSQGATARRVRSYKSNFTVNHMLTSSTVYEASLGWFKTGLLIAPRNLKAEAADTTGFWGFLRRTGIWDRYFFRAEDWVFDWQKYSRYEVEHGVTDTIKSKQDAVLKMYRSFWLDENNNNVYAWPNHTNFASNYLTTNNPYGVAGLFVGEGDDRTWHYRSTGHLLGKLDFTHTASTVHQLKAGLSLTRYDLSMYDNSLPWDQNPFWDAFSYQPLVAAAYVQDQADFEDLVVHAGLRLDLLNSEADVRAFPESLGSRREIADSMLPVKVKVKLSPRLGLSYPVTERVKFRFSYGHFFKNPTFDNLYMYSGRSAAELRSRGNVVVGNANMSTEKTIAYELGFDAQLTDVLVLDVTAFYKDVYDLSGVRAVYALPQPYSMYYNVEYARIQGFEVSVSRSLSQYWTGNIAYTYQVAKGTASTANSQYQRERPLQLDYYLDQDQRHSANASLTLSFPRDFFSIPLREADASLILAVASGTPYTPTDQRGNATGLANSARLPGSVSFDGRVGRSFHAGGLTFTVNCDVTNIMNSAEVVNVYSATGRPDYDGRAFTPYEFAPGVAFGDYYYHPARDFDHDGYLTRGELYDSYVRAYQDYSDAPTNYGPPRKIRLGLSMSF